MNVGKSKYSSSWPTTIQSMTVPSYDSATQSSSYPSNLTFTWLQSGCLATDSHLWLIAKGPKITWSSFATFPPGFPKKSVGKLAEKVTSYWSKSPPTVHLLSTHLPRIPMLPPDPHCTFLEPGYASLQSCVLFIICNVSYHIPLPPSCALPASHYDSCTPSSTIHSWHGRNTSR